MSWLKTMIGDWAAGSQAREIAEYTSKLESMDDESIAAVLAITTHLRHCIEKRNTVSLMDPASAVARRPELVLILHRTLQDFVRRNQHADAGALKVWIMTLRAGSEPRWRSNLRPRTRLCQGSG
jgi:hypothetical protein